MQKTIIIISLLCSLVLNGCCNVRNPEDPYEKFNRAAFKMNDTLDKAFLKPAAQFYHGMTPRVISDRISNAFRNISGIPTIANDFLQLDFYYAGRDLTRFIINSTVGLGGLFDPAKHIGLPYHSNDFGLTLGRWGIRNTPYFVIPFFGPSTIRDAIALIPYYYMTVYPYINPLALRYSLLALYSIDFRAQLLQIEDLANEVSVDPYVFQRDAYLQNRRGLLQGKLVEDRGNDIYVEDGPVATPAKQPVKTKKKIGRHSGVLS